MLNRVGKVILVASFLAFALVVLGSREPPLFQDYPEWVYQGVLLAKMLTGHPVTGYALKLYPVPNSITTVGLGLLTVPFGWQLAAKLWLVLYLIFATGISLYAGSVFGIKDAGLWWVLPTTLFLGRLFWFGTISFNIGLCFFLLLACLLYRQDERASLFAPLLIICFFIHLIVYAAAGVMILLYCMQYRRWKLIYVGLATLPLVLWYALGRLLSHSSENEIARSPASHLALPCLLALIVLTISFFNRRRPIHRLAGRALVYLSGLVAGIAFASAFIPKSILSAKELQNIFILQLKASQPFTLFGFVNITYIQIQNQVFSATLNLFHQPLFLILMAMDILVGAILIFDIARTLLEKRNSSKDRQGNNLDQVGFLWDFVTLFGLLYIFCPPNALGVIGIDVRLAQLGLVPALFLIARRSDSMLRFASLPCVLLMAACLYQVRISQNRGRIDEIRMTFPLIVNQFGDVDPRNLVRQYEAIRADVLDHSIMATGIFTETSPHQ